MRIFLAEDNVADVWLIEESLRRRAVPYTLELYHTAEDAADAAMNCGHAGAPVPDLMLLDFNLPCGQGLDILSAAASNPRLSAVPKMIVTSLYRPGEMERARELGATCFITKPPNLADFLEGVGLKVIETVAESRKA